MGFAVSTLPTRSVKDGSRPDRTEALFTSLAPDLADFDGLMRAAYAGLPQVFRDLSRDVVLQVEDFPSPEVCDLMELETSYDLLGLYHGVDLTQKMGAAPVDLPDRVHLYRRPILDFWAEGEETLKNIVTHVLIHEIGHHFGLSDEDMEAIEAAAD